MKKRKKILLFLYVSSISVLAIIGGFIVMFPGTFQSIQSVPGEKGTVHILTGRLLTSNPKVIHKSLDVDESERCDAMRNEIEYLFDQAKKCERDSDCIVENRGMFCPFGCFQIHNKAYDIDEIMKKVMVFQEQKCYLCEYSCMTSPKVEELKCRENRCIDARYTR